MNVHSYLYNETVTPAMPVAEVRFVSPYSQERAGAVQAIIDSGSDGTMAPLTLLDEIGALSMGTAVMSGIWGQRRRVDIYIVNIEIGPHLLPGIRVAGVSEAMDVILGRNVLNQIKIVLNGPANTLEIPSDDSA
ncbi:MAG: hypothetical protein GY803_00775 [Chloroflexi bacterium]|nr:hypothetical protein [Chloroflexota bacterium]